MVIKFWYEWSRKLGPYSEPYEHYTYDFTIYNWKKSTSGKENYQQHTWEWESRKRSQKYCRPRLRWKVDLFLLIWFLFLLVLYDYNNSLTLCSIEMCLEKIREKRLKKCSYISAFKSLINVKYEQTQDLIFEPYAFKQFHNSWLCQQG